MGSCLTSSSISLVELGIFRLLGFFPSMSFCSLYFSRNLSNLLTQSCPKYTFYPFDVCAVYSNGPLSFMLLVICVLFFSLVSWLRFINFIGCFKAQAFGFIDLFHCFSVSSFFSSYLFCFLPPPPPSTLGLINSCSVLQMEAYETLLFF